MPTIAADSPEDRATGRRLRGAGAAARKVTVLGTASSEGITLTALTLARLMVRRRQGRGGRSRRIVADDVRRRRSIRTRLGLPN